MSDNPYDWMIEDDEEIEPRCPCCDGRGIVSDDVDYLTCPECEGHGAIP